MKTFVTFGFDHTHTHVVDGKTFDKDCVAVIESESAERGRELAFEFFGRKFSMEYPEDHWDDAKMSKYYPRGYINVN